MAVVVVSGEKFPGVDFGSAPGTGYIIGTTPVCELLRVDEADFAATLVGVKYYHHSSGDPNGSNRPPVDLLRMTMLMVSATPVSARHAKVIQNDRDRPNPIVAAP